MITGFVTMGGSKDPPATSHLRPRQSPSGIVGRVEPAQILHIKASDRPAPKEFSFVLSCPVPEKEKKRQQITVESLNFLPESARMRLLCLFKQGLKQLLKFQEVRSWAACQLGLLKGYCTVASIDYQSLSRASNSGSQVPVVPMVPEPSPHPPMSSSLNPPMPPPSAPTTAEPKYQKLSPNHLVIILEKREYQQSIKRAIRKLAGPRDHPRGKRVKEMPNGRLVTFHRIRKNFVEKDLFSPVSHAVRPARLFANLDSFKLDLLRSLQDLKEKYVRSGDEELESQVLLTDLVQIWEKIVQF